MALGSRMMAWIVGRPGRAIVLGLIGSGVAAAGASAREGPHPENLRDREVIQTAYHAESDTYFRLVSDVVNQTGTGKWAYAVEKARRASFKGREGRLAKVDTADKHQFIVEQFDFDDLMGAPGIWIGLRYWCGVRMLTWVDGEEHKAGAFGAWDTPWYAGEIRCEQNDIPYMGVFYDRRSSRWRAMGYKKRFRYYLIEFPSEQDEVADSKE